MVVALTSSLNSRCCGSWYSRGLVGQREANWYPPGVTKPPAHAIECLKDAGRQSVWLVRRPGEDPRTVKTWSLGPWLVFKMFLGISQPQRQNRGARRLRQAGVNTPGSRPGWRVSFHGLLPVLAAELDYVPGETALRLLGDELVSDSIKCRSARAVGGTVARLIQAGLFNRDLKLTNLIVDRSGAEPIVWMIDPVGVRRMRDEVAETVRMLDRLAVQPLFYGVPLPRSVVIATLLTALRPLGRVERRAVVGRLRRYGRCESERWRTSKADPRSTHPAGKARPPRYARAGN